VKVKHLPFFSFTLEGPTIINFDVLPMFLSVYILKKPVGTKENTFIFKAIFAAFNILSHHDETRVWNIENSICNGFWKKNLFDGYSIGVAQ